MLCHTESIECEGVSYPVSIECSDPVTTEYSITFAPGATSVVKVSQIEEYLVGMITEAKASMGYDVQYVPGSGKIAGDAFLCKIQEPSNGTVGQYACAFLQAGGFAAGDAACLITGVAADGKDVCGNLDVCPLVNGTVTTYSLEFWEPVSVVAISSELLSLALSVNYRLIDVSLGEDSMEGNLTVYENGEGSFAKIIFGGLYSGLV